MKRSVTKHKFILSLLISSITVVLLCFMAVIFLFPSKYKKDIANAASKYDLPPDLINAVIWTESGFNSQVKSTKGAVGLMQLMPATADWINGSKLQEDQLINAKINIDLGCKYLRYLLDKFERYDLMLAAYNAGEGNVEKWIKTGKADEIPFRETREYIKKVNAVKMIYGIKSVYIKILNA